MNLKLTIVSSKSMTNVYGFLGEKSKNGYFGICVGGGVHGMVMGYWIIFE